MAKYAIARRSLAVANGTFPELPWPSEMPAGGNVEKQREGASPKSLTPSTVSQIVAMTRWWAVEHNKVGLITHALRCDLQVQRLIPVDSLHVRIADGLEELGVQLPHISGANTSPEFGLWESHWRKT